MTARTGAGANRWATRWLADACRLFLSREDTIVFDVDTGQIEQLGPAHQLEPMLHSLASAGLIEGGVPEVLKESWLASYCVTLLRNHRRFGFLQGIVDDCEQAGVGLLVLKGPAHIVRVWHDAGLRPMIDIDLLCRGEELSAVTEIVRAAGFEPLGKTSPFHLEFRTPDTGDRIELHFDIYEIFGDRAAFLDMIWRSAEIVEHADLRVPVLSTECCLVFDLGHLLHNDLRIGMRSLVDFAGQLRDGRFENGQIRSLLELTDLRSEYDCIVSLTDGLGWTCVAASGPDSDLMQQLRDYWAALPEDPGPGAMREMLYHPGMLRKLRKGFDVLFPPASHLRERSPTRSITALRLTHIYKMLTGVSGDLFRGPGLNRMPSISLKRDVYRRRAERRRG